MLASVVIAALAWRRFGLLGLLRYPQFRSISEKRRRPRAGPENGPAVR